VVRALLRQPGWRVPTGSAEGFIRRVLALRVPGRLLSELAPLLAVMRQVNQQLAYSDARIAAVARADERVERLQRVAPEEVDEGRLIRAVRMGLGLEQDHRFLRELFQRVNPLLRSRLGVGKVPANRSRSGLPYDLRPLFFRPCFISCRVAASSTE
jgi:hypothetical protein